MSVILNASTSSGFVQTADTSGQIELQSNGTTVLALTSTGTTITGTQSVSGNLSFNSGYGSSAVAYGCRAWVNFDGAAISVRGHGNVASISDNGVGDYTINFITAMPNANYSVCSTGPSVVNSGGVYQVAQNSATAPTTSSYRINVQSAGGTQFDSSLLQLAFFR